MIKRKLKNVVLEALNMFPVVSLTGPRQSGKSTLLQNELTDYTYINLEDLEIRDFATFDPKGFLEHYGTKIIIDEVQYAPELFSQIQVIVDKLRETGMYVLSGSQNFLMAENISQSLAGRVAPLELLPFSISEIEPTSVGAYILKGGYPRLYDKEISYSIFYESYIKTYIQRDVKLIKNIVNTADFLNVLRLLANRIGMQLDYSDIANACGVTVPTVRSWIQVLEASYIIYRLSPYYENFDKTVRKSPKIYFYDTGLACHLLHIRNTEQLLRNAMYGHLFENCVINEVIKGYYNNGLRPDMYFYREANKHEIDLVINVNGDLHAVEIKSSSTFHEKYVSELLRFQDIAKLPDEQLHLIYSGTLDAKVKNIQLSNVLRPDTYGII